VIVPPLELERKVAPWRPAPVGAAERAARADVGRGERVRAEREDLGRAAAGQT
jgi:hypothetical protein